MKCAAGRRDKRRLVLSDLTMRRDPSPLFDVKVADHTGERRSEALPSSRLSLVWITEAPSLSEGTNLFDKSCAIATISP